MWRGGIWLVLGSLLGISCETSEAKRDDESYSCERLFGVPSENTGLTKEQCGPECFTCSGEKDFAAHTYSDEQVEALLVRTHDNPSELLGKSPYDTPASFPEQPDKVCAVLFVGEDSYGLATYDSAEEAVAVGAQVTHEGACGACSSLQDLAVYIAVPDLTEPVRRCNVQNLNAGVEELAACISKLGFTDACAEIWAYNSLNTRELCYDECIAALEEPYHLPDGSPNACIQCDEDNSGPVFKGASGRTRRNSGLPTALCRPCEGVAQLSHVY